MPREQGYLLTPNLPTPHALVHSGGGSGPFSRPARPNVDKIGGADLRWPGDAECLGVHARIFENFFGCTHAPQLTPQSRRAGPR